MDTDAFSHCHEETIRWSDQDALGHVNNVQSLRYLESARIAYVHDVLRDPDAAGDPVTNVILADIQCTFRRQLHFPGVVEVYTRTARVGRSSVELEQVVVSRDAPDPALTARSVMVWFDYDAQASARVPDTIRERLRDYEILCPTGL